jgi:3-hydroxyethyl bacteriochlorophyllide a dehydrogenase
LTVTQSVTAVVFEQPGSLAVRSVQVPQRAANDCLVDIEWSGVSTGTERLLWDGRMPAFPGLAYPLVPGYESVGRLREVPEGSDLRPGQRVFVPGSAAYVDVRGLFGGAAEALQVPAERLIPLPETLQEEGVLLALAATAHHALAACGEGRWPELIVGHGVLGRLLARLVVALGGPPPTVWEHVPERHAGARGYAVCCPGDDPRRDYRCICDASGDPQLLDTLVARLASGGRLVLAGFYHQPLQFQFAPAFRCELELKVAAEWRPPDLARVSELITGGTLSLSGLISHQLPARWAAPAYHLAFCEQSCLKMILDWRS